MAHPIGHLLRDAGFTRLWAAGALTNAMRWQEILITGVFTFEITQSAFAVALVMMMRALPMLLIGAFAGALSEALDRRRLMIAGLMIMITSAGAIATLGVIGRLAV